MQKITDMLLSKISFLNNSTGTKLLMLLLGCFFNLCYNYMCNRMLQGTAVFEIQVSMYKCKKFPIKNVIYITSVKIDMYLIKISIKCNKKNTTDNQKKQINISNQQQWTDRKADTCKHEKTSAK